ncbi:uncharacterized protein LOC141632860 [Silene latifolia]|uniref:uncharacterized protein LOC141632860 n=1 Tax=Silene latifolia TaxID=37657 RepID=UPI003D783655
MHTRIQGPWIVCGDFNNILGYDERIGSVVTEVDIKRFLECTQTCDLADISAHGVFFTWSNKQDGDGRRFSSVDRVLVNMEWLMLFPDCTSTFLPEGLFDHNPCVIDLWRTSEGRKRLIKYFNVWGRYEKFSDIICSGLAA